MEEHTHTPWIVGIVLSLLIGLGVGISTGMVIGRQQKKPIPVTQTKAISGTVIDGVKLSPSNDIADNLSNVPNAKIFTDLFEAAGLKDYLHNVGPYTVLLPLNDVFSDVNQDQLKTLRSAANQAELKRLLMNNIIEGTYTAADLRVLAARGQTIKTVTGEELKLALDDRQLKITDSYSNTGTLQPVDAISANGVIHQTDHLMIPAGVTLSVTKK